MSQQGGCYMIKFPFWNAESQLGNYRIIQERINGGQGG